MEIPLPFRKILFAAPLLLLIACSGGGGGSGGAESPMPSSPKPPDNRIPPVTPSLTSYQMLLGEATGFLETNNLKNGFAGHVTLPKNMPQSGRARFTGASIVAVGKCTNDGGPHLVGKTNLTADFAKRTVSGTVSDFSAIGNHKTNGGKLNVSGKIAGAKLTGKLAGNVSFDKKNFSIDVPLTGVFLNNTDGIVLQSAGKTKAGESFSTTITGAKNPISK